MTGCLLLQSGRFVRDVVQVPSGLIFFFSYRQGSDILKVLLLHLDPGGKTGPPGPPAGPKLYEPELVGPDGRCSSRTPHVFLVRQQTPRLLTNPGHGFKAYYCINIIRFMVL